MQRFRCDGSLSGTPLIFRKGLGLESKRCCSLFILDPRIHSIIEHPWKATKDNLRAPMPASLTVFGERPKRAAFAEM